MNNIESNTGEIVMYQPDETIRLEVRMGEETVWLTQQQMAELFDKDRTVIGRHIRNIYKEEELERNITCAKFAHMGADGDQEYEYTAYNLDVIISVGYRVKSRRGTKFRQWANQVLKEYLLRGYVVNTRIAALEQHVVKQDAHPAGFTRCKCNTLGTHSVTVVPLCWSTQRSVQRGIEHHPGNARHVGNRDVAIKVHVGSLKDERLWIQFKHMLSRDNHIGY